MLKQLHLKKITLKGTNINSMIGAE
jgi:hypothetical protein